MSEIKNKIRLFELVSNDGENKKAHITYNQDNHEIAIDSVNLIAICVGFIDFRDSLKKEIRGGELMFDAPKFYKWMSESELLTNYLLGLFY